MGPNERFTGLCYNCLPTARIVEGMLVESYANGKAMIIQGKNSRSVSE